MHHLRFHLVITNYLVHFCCCALLIHSASPAHDHCTVVTIDAIIDAIFITTSADSNHICQRYYDTFTQYSFVFNCANGTCQFMITFILLKYHYCQHSYYFSRFCLCYYSKDCHFKLYHSYMY